MSTSHLIRARIAQAEYLRKKGDIKGALTVLRSAERLCMPAWVALAMAGTAALLLGGFVLVRVLA